MPESDDPTAQDPADDGDGRPPRRRQEREDYDDRPRRRRQARGVEAADFLIPTNVSAWSMAACYFGLFSCFIPALGFLMALIALPSGIIALRRREKGSSYGSVTGDVRAVIGIVCSSLTLLGHLIVFVLVLAKQ